MRDRLLLLVFFLSGATALVYELLWESQLELVFGTTIEGLTAILSTFFAGLTLGSFIFGRLADRLSLKKLLVVYGLVEIGIGVLAFASPVVFTNLGHNSLLFLLIPATLIGGTFPLITRYFATQENLKNNVSRLYAVNTLGAVVGVLLTTFWILQIFGVRGGIWLAASINMILGVVILVLSQVAIEAKAKPTVLPSKQEKVSASPHAWRAHILLFVFFLTGMLALALEVFWTKALVLVFGGSFYSFAVILISFLLGIALGSFFARFIPKERSWLWFGLLQGALSLWVLISLPLFNKLPGFYVTLFGSSSNFPGLIGVIFLISALIIMPATFFSGASFPLAVELYKKKTGRIGERIGTVFAANTAGAVVGPLLVYFLLLPTLGLQKGLIAISIVYSVIAITILAHKKRIAVVVLISFLLLLGANLWFWPWDRQELTAGRYLNPNYSAQGSELLFYKEGKNTTVTVKKTGLGDTVLQVNGKVDASAFADLDTELLLGHLPLLFAKNPQKVLVIGFGSGITAGAVSTYPVETIDIVEIEYAVIAAAPHFSEHNHDILSDKRTHVVVQDGRNYLRNSVEKYDVITSEPSNPWIAGIGNLFSQEFYELAKSRLTDDGIMLQWIHTNSMSEDNLKIAIRTFTYVFPEVTLRSNWLGSDIFLMGSKKTLEIIEDVPPEALADLMRIHTSPAEIFSFKIAGNEALRKAVGDGKIHSDNFPWLELLAPMDLYTTTRLENLTFLSSFDSNPLRQLIFTGQIEFETDNSQAVVTFADVLQQEKGNYLLESAYADILIAEARRVLRRKEYVKAEEFIKEAIMLTPEDFIPYRLLGLVYFAQEKSAQALDVLTKSVAKYPYDTQSHMYLGIAYLMQGELTSAEQEFLQALELDTKNIVAWNNLAKAYLDQGKKEQARDAWRESLNIDPNQSEVRKAINALN